MMDGVDLSRVLREGAPSPRHEFFYYWDNELRAVRKGNYKAHFVTSGAYGEGAPRTLHDPPLLFNLAEDPGERVDVAAANPAIVADLIAATERHRRTVPATTPLFDALLPAPQKDPR
jgi:arylsulfatase A-like enzyme